MAKRNKKKNARKQEAVKASKQSKQPTTTALAIEPVVSEKVIKPPPKAMVQNITKDEYKLLALDDPIHYAPFKVGKCRRRSDELELSVYDKKIAGVPIPESGIIRPEVEIIINLLLARMAELTAAVSTKRDIGMMKTKAQPVLQLIELVGLAYL